MRFVVLLALLVSNAYCQLPWPPKWDNFKFTLEVRSREEARTGVTFGKDADLENPLFRTRIGAQWTPVSWLKLTAMGQDSRAPEYGTTAPTSARDTMDLHESTIELFPDRKRGFGAIAGRQMLTYGEGRLIGTPQWSNTSRTYDTARVYYRLPGARIEFLLASIVKVLPDSYNVPVLGDRLWGMYDSFTELIPHGVVEAYVLRRDQNRPGGFTAAGTLGINTFGGRATGPAAFGLKYSVEAAAQTGHAGAQTQRAAAWYSSVSRRVALRWPLDLSVEYKYASGSADPQSSRSGTFDQLYAANHDKFGHADLFGWRNIHNLRSLDTLRVTKDLALNFMYDNYWLASARDSLYNGQGRPIVRSARGDAGKHVGQEADWFATYSHSGFTFGAGFAHLFAGEFLRNTTPGVNTRYLYLFQGYSF
jgi:Alginate export